MKPYSDMVPPVVVVGGLMLPAVVVAETTQVVVHVEVEAMRVAPVVAVASIE